jgi:hypothetical protein
MDGDGATVQAEFHVGARDTHETRSLSVHGAAKFGLGKCLMTVLLLAEESRGSGHRNLQLSRLFSGLLGAQCHVGLVRFGLQQQLIVSRVVV